MKLPRKRHLIRLTASPSLCSCSAGCAVIPGSTTAQSAWSTDRGHPIAAGVIAALRAEHVILPAPAVIERAAMAGRARARKRAADALLAGVSEVQIAKLD
jgi:hypothetical protein